MYTLFSWKDPKWHVGPFIKQKYIVMYKKTSWNIKIKGNKQIFYLDLFIIQNLLFYIHFIPK